LNPNRLDGWNKEEEQMLAEIILSSIRNGGTQLSAFQEAGQKLKKTPTACGHRWNRVLRKKYATKIEAAKEYWRRTQAKPHDQQNSPASVESESTTIESLSSEIKRLQISLQLIISNETKLTNEIESLREEMTQLVKNLSALQQDTLLLLRIFERTVKQFFHEKQEKGKNE
jgi:prespore-specific regulator